MIALLLTILMGYGDTAPITKVDVSPSRINISSPFDSAQLLVTGERADGLKFDLTGEAQILSAPDFISISPSLLLRTTADGSGTIRLKAGGRTVNVPVRSSGARNRTPTDFEIDVQPVLTRLGCNAGICHGSAQGKDGFFLSLRGYDAPADHLALTDDLASRRVNLAAPQRSLFLQKPTGAVPHRGGQILSPDSNNYALLRAWVEEGAKFGGDAASLESIRVEPEDPTIALAGGTQQFRVVATYADRTERDVTAHAFLEPGDIEILAVDESGRATALRRGEAPILVRYHGQYAATTVFVLGDRDGWAWKETPTNNYIDEHVHAKLRKVNVSQSDLCDDADFLRRVHFDLTGQAPTPEEARTFLLDERDEKTKRDEVVDRLLGSAAYVRHWTNRWADLLQVNSKFIGADGAKKFRNWIKRQIASNTPYDRFCAEILGASGSTADSPPSAYYRITKEADLVMENTTQLFLGVRFNCNKCHDHPFERWTQKQHWGLAAYFSRVSASEDPNDSTDEIVTDKQEGELKHPDTGEVVPPIFPYEVSPSHKPSGASTRRQELVQWMTSANNPYFAKSYVNRIWGYMFGRGLIEPVDDIRAGNRPTHPALLQRLTEEFVAEDFDVRHILEVICKSRTYQLSLETNRWNDDDTVNYSHAKARRLPAEIMYDAIHRATGTEVAFEGQRPGVMATELVDGTADATDGFLGLFGRPSRESSCECARSNNMSLGHALSLVNGPTVGDAISGPGNEITSLVNHESDDAKVIDELFMRTLSRPPSPEQLDLFLPELDPSRPENIASLKATDRDAAAARYQEWESSLPRVSWKQCEPGSAKSEQGGQLIINDDASFELTGEIPEKDTYTVSLWTELEEITGLRLEVWKGASESGNFVLADLSMTVQAAGSESGLPAPFKRVTADFSQDGWNVSGAIDEDPSSGWGIFPERDKLHMAVFELTEKIATPGGAHLLVTMKQPFGTRHNLAKFRFSVTDAAGEVRYVDMSDALMAALDSPLKEREAAATKKLHSMFIETDPELAKKIRLAGARDITWALLNSPAFLYNR